jgi:hypothetical protein
VLVAFVLPSLAMATDFDYVGSINKLMQAENPKAAEALAYRYTLDSDDAPACLTFLEQFKSLDYRQAVYSRAWELLRATDNQFLLEKFVQLEPQGVFIFPAISLLFHNFYKKQNTISAYHEFINSYPNSPQAILALEEVYRLEFEQTKKENTVAAYDVYCKNFPYSSYYKQAYDSGKAIEGENLEKEVKGGFLSWFSDQQQKKETVARRVYNEMRMANADGFNFLVQRKYEFMNEKFNDTKAFSEMLDRQETREFNIYIKESIAKIAELKAVMENGLKQISNSAADSISNLSYRNGPIAYAINMQMIESSMDLAERIVQGQNELAQRRKNSCFSVCPGSIFKDYDCTKRCY